MAAAEAPVDRDKPVTLPQLQAAMANAIDAVTTAEEAAEQALVALWKVGEPLSRRIERNRRRSARAHRSKSADQLELLNGDAPDVAVKLVNGHGFVRVCRRCGKQVMS
jgi:hypothetical protein